MKKIIISRPRRVSSGLIILILIIIGGGAFFYFYKTQPDKIEYPDYEDAIDYEDTMEKSTASQSEADRQAGSSLLTSVPFILQAPFANWDNPVFQDACEEAAILMVKYWLQGKEITKQEAYDEIISLAEWEQEKYGNFYDHSAEDTAQIMRDYIDYQNIAVEHNIDAKDIKSEIGRGNLVIVPINGQAIGNPYYTQPGPERHMLVIIGWDDDTGEFITNDSGTRMGRNYRYLEDVLFWSIRDYPTGHKVPIQGIKKSMIVVGPKNT